MRVWASGAIGLVLLVLAACGGAEPAPAELPGAPPPSLPSLSPVSTVEPSAARPPARLQGTLEAYETLSADWQRARSVFFAAVTDGRPRSLPQQRALAAAYLRGMRAFATGLRSRRWPPATAGPVAALLAANAAQQAPVAAMAAAGSVPAFTAALADYGVGAQRENAAVAAVQRALGG